MRLIRRRDPEPESEPDLGPTREELDGGLEPADALWEDPGFLPDPPGPVDVLDLGWAVWREQALWLEARAREAGPEPKPDLEAE